MLLLTEHCDPFLHHPGSAAAYDAISYMLGMYTLMDMPPTYVQIKNNCCTTEAFSPFGIVHLGFGFRRLLTKWASLHSGQLMVLLYVDLVAATRTLDDTVGRDPLEFDGLDLTLDESAVPAGMIVE